MRKFLENSFLAENRIFGLFLISLAAIVLGIATIFIAVALMFITSVIVLSIYVFFFGLEQYDVIGQNPFDYIAITFMEFVDKLMLIESVRLPSIWMEY